MEKKIEITKVINTNFDNIHKTLLNPGIHSFFL